MNYRAIDGRIAVNPSEHFLETDRIDHEQTYALLKQIGFKVLSIDIVALARSRIVLSRVLRGVNPRYAPDLVDDATFVRWLFTQLGIRLPPRSAQQFALGKVVYVDEHKAGDLVFFRGEDGQYEKVPEKAIGHVGLLTGEGTYIHVKYNDPTGVVEEPINQSQLAASRGVRRILTEDTLTLKIPPDICLEVSEGLRWVIEKHL